MITKNPEIGTPEYWDKFYKGELTGTQDNSKTVRPTNAFDRFEAVLKHIDPETDKMIIDVGSGHARIPKMIKARWPKVFILATDQSPEACKAAKFDPYCVTTGYVLPTLKSGDKYDLVMITQALEYIEDQDKFIEEAKRVGKKILITCPKGEMEKWSQFRAYTEENLKEFVSKYGTIESFEDWGAIMLIKAKFFE